MKLFVCVTGGVAGGAVSLFVGLWLLGLEKYQTVASAAIAVAATLIAAIIAWQTVQYQLNEQRKLRLQTEADNILRFQEFLAALSEELSGYRHLLTDAERSLRDESVDFDTAINSAQRVPFTTPGFADPFLNYRTRISMEALNSYILRYEQLLESVIAKRGFPLVKGAFDNTSMHSYKRVLYGCESKSNQLLEDLVKFDAKYADDRLSEIRRQISSS